MDILSHGLWGGLAFGRKHKKSFWLAFFFGVAPDLFSFGIFFIDRLVGHGFTLGRPDPSIIPEYVYHAYNVTHSLVIFTLAFLVAWFILKRPLLEMGAWAFHIVMDIFTHSDAFFPTPFLWPLSDFHVNGHSWGSPWIFFPNVALLAILYLYYFRVHKPRKLKQTL